MNRRVRLALFLAILAATGAPAPARTFDAARSSVSIAWFRGDRTRSPQVPHAGTAFRAPATARSASITYRDPVRSEPLLPYSLFQRPPPLSN